MRTHPAVLGQTTLNGASMCNGLIPMLSCFLRGSGETWIDKAKVKWLAATKIMFQFCICLAKHLFLLLTVNHTYCHSWRCCHEWLFVVAWSPFTLPQDGDFSLEISKRTYGKHWAKPVLLTIIRISKWQKITLALKQAGTNGSLRTYNHKIIRVNGSSMMENVAHFSNGFVVHNHDNRVCKETTKENYQWPMVAYFFALSELQTMNFHVASLSFSMILFPFRTSLRETSCRF